MFLDYKNKRVRTPSGVLCLVAAQRKVVALLNDIALLTECANFILLSSINIALLAECGLPARDGFIPTPPS